MDTLFAKCALTLTRVSLGWLMFYAGITKVMNPAWSAEFYLKGAKTFGGFYNWLLSSSLMPAVNLTNAWGLTLLGISLIVGLGVRLSSMLGAVLMLLYYFPVLSFPYVGEHSYIVDDHIIYALLLVFFAAARVGRIWGLDKLHGMKWFG